MPEVVSLEDGSRASTEFSIPWEGGSVNVRARRERGRIIVLHERVVLWGASLRCLDKGEMHLSLRPRELAGLHPDCLQVAVARQVWAEIGLPELREGEGKLLVFPRRGCRRRARRG